MVYESDFYTTRRPYTRPYVSSYNVTPIRGPYYLYDPYTSSFFVRTVPHMPYTAHKRLVTIVHTPVRIYHAGAYLPIKLHTRVRPSIIAAELNRIRYLTRPSFESHMEKYLTSRDYINFDDEAREIRAKTDNLLRRIHVFVPRPCLSDYDETSPERLRSNDYVQRIINAKNARKEIESLPWYTTPEKRDIGPGHLACIKFAGGRPQSRRRPYYTVGDLVPGDVKSDVNLMSFYVKNRKAAEDASPQHVQRSEPVPVVPVKETHDAPAPSVTWADEVVQEEETTAEQPAEQPAEPEVQQQQQQPEVAAAKPEKKKERKLKKKESTEAPVEAEAEEVDENGVKKQPDEETLKRIQEYIDKKAAEKKLEEERREWEAAERRRIAEEKEIARLAQLKQEEEQRLAEIKEQERLEAERQEVERRAEEARKEAERLVEDEKMFHEAVAQALADEQERLAKEQEEQEQQKKKEEEEEEKMANMDMSAADPASSEIIDGGRHSEEHSIHQDLSDQDNEAKPYEVDHDDDTQIEEEEHEEETELENPYVDGEGAAASAPVVDEPVEEDAPRYTPRKSGACDEGGFDWSEFENEEGAQEAATEAQPQAEEEATPAEETQQVFEESETEAQVDVDEAQVEEATAEETAEETEEPARAEEEETETQVTDEVQVVEAKAEEEEEEDEEEDEE